MRKWCGISYTPRRSEEGGFTLIELMVVIAIIAMASAALIGIAPDGRGRLVDEADRFALRLAALRDRAVVMTRPTRVRVTSDGYDFDEARAGQWGALTDDSFRPVHWRKGTTVRLVGSNESASIRFDETGMVDTSVRIVLHSSEGQSTITVTTNGKVRVDE